MSSQGAKPLLYDDSHSVLLFTDRPSRRSEIVDAIELVGARVGATAPVADALAQIDARITLDAVVVDAVEAGPAFDALVSHLNRAAEAGRYSSVILLVPEMIDAAFACAPHPDVALLCGEDALERAIAIAEALAGRPVRLNDVGAENIAPRLRQMSEDMIRMARVLASFAGDEQAAPAPAPELPAPSRRGNDAIIDAMQLRAMIRARRLRELYFPPDLFADPAWDMLLDLMAARLERRQVAVSSLCIAAAVPSTTALRWIKLLTDQGLLVRFADPTDGRRVFIELADSAAERMMNYLAAAQRLSTITP